MLTLRKLGLGLFIVLAGILPVIASAAPSKPSEAFTLKENLLPKGPESVIEFVVVIGNWIFTGLLVLAVIFVLLAAYHYMGGNEEGVSKAHKMLIYTAVAVAVAVLAYGLVHAVKRFAETPPRAAAFHSPSVAIHHPFTV
jgi:magnesium-transporting ATPase (P-type)